MRSHTRPCAIAPHNGRLHVAHTHARAVHSSARSHSQIIAEWEKSYCFFFSLLDIVISFSTFRINSIKFIYELFLFNECVRFEHGGE